MIGVASFPSLDHLKGNPYWILLKSSMDQSGYRDVDSAVFTLRWILSRRDEVAILHFHFVQPFYEYEYHYARLKWVFRMARNLIVAKILGYKLVFTLHDLTPTYPLHPHWVDLLGHWVIIHLADRVIVHCQEARHLLKKVYKRTRSVVVVDHPSYINYYENQITREEAREKLDLDSDHFVFTFFGGIRPNKGLEKLISTFKQLVGETLNLVIAGTPSPPAIFIEQLHTIAGSDPRIRLFFKNIPDQEIEVFLNAADILVFPFERILTSGSTMLALSFGKPVIAPRMGCIPELVTESAGWLYQPDTEDGLLLAMQQAITADLVNKGKSAMEIARRYRKLHLADLMYRGLCSDPSPYQADHAS